MSHMPAAEKPSIALPVIALVSVLVCWPVGLVLSIVCAVKYIGQPGTEARIISIVALVLNFVVVVPTIGILAAIAIPNFIMFQCRSKQSEAKGNLKALYVAEESYRAEFDSYAACPPELCNGAENVIGFTPKGQKIRYTYTVLSHGKEEFRAEARANVSELKGDLWVIDHTNTLQNLENGCDR